MNLLSDSIGWIADHPKETAAATALAAAVARMYIRNAAVRHALEMVCRAIEHTANDHAKRAVHTLEPSLKPNARRALHRAISKSNGYPHNPNRSQTP